MDYSAERKEQVGEPQSAHVKIVAALLAAGADPNARDNDGRTPMHVAAAAGSAEAVAALAADPNARDDGGVTPLYFAVNAGSEEAVAALRRASLDYIRAYAPPPPPPPPELPWPLRLFLFFLTFSKTKASVRRCPPKSAA